MSSSLVEAWRGCRRYRSRHRRRTACGRKNDAWRATFFDHRGFGNVLQSWPGSKNVPELEECPRAPELCALVTVKEGEEEVVVARRVPPAAVATTPERKALLDALIAARLVVTREGVVGVAHEALLKHWKHAKDWITYARSLLRTRATVVGRAGHWLKEDKRPDALLPAGKLLDEAANLLQQWGGDLDAPVREYIKESLGQQSRIRRRRLAYLIGIPAVGVGLLIWGFVASQFALVKKQEALTNEYFNRLRLARTMWLDPNNNVAEAERLLTAEDGNKFPPEMRRWEWDYLTGLCHAYPGWFDAHRGSTPKNRRGVNALVFTPDGDQLITGGEDGAIKVWRRDDPRPTREPLKEIAPESPFAVLGLALSRDGRYLASCGKEMIVTLWDLKEANPVVVRLPAGAHKAPVNGLAFSASGRYVVSGDENGRVVVWDVARKQELKGLDLNTDASTDPVFAVACSPAPAGKESEFVAVARGEKGEYSVPVEKGKDGKLRGEVQVWGVNFDQQTRKPMGDPIRKDTGPVYGVAFADADGLVTANFDTTVRYWRIEPKNRNENMRHGVTLFNHWSAPVRAIAVAECQPVPGKPACWYAASGSSDRTVKVIDVGQGMDADDAGHEDVPKLRGHLDTVRTVAWDPQGRYLASGSQDGRVIVWDKSRNQEARAFERAGGGPILTVDVRNDIDSKRCVFAAGDVNGEVMLWDSSKNKPDPAPGHGGAAAIYCVSFSRDGRWLASADADGKIYFGPWDRKGSVLCRRPAAVLSMTFSTDSAQIVAGYADGVIKAWDVQTRAETTYAVASPSSPVCSVAFCPNGRVVASGAGRRIDLWSTAGVRLGGVEQVSRKVSSIAFGREGRSLAVGFESGEIEILDGRTLKSIHQRKMSGHRGPVLSVSFDLTGERLVSGSADNTMKVWDVATGQEVFTGGHNFKVYRAVFSPVGRRIVTASGYPLKDPDGQMFVQGKVKIWDADDWPHRP